MILLCLILLLRGLVNSIIRDQAPDLRGYWQTDFVLPQNGNVLPLVRASRTQSYVLPAKFIGIGARRQCLHQGSCTLNFNSLWGLLRKCRMCKRHVESLAILAICFLHRTGCRRCAFRVPSSQQNTPRYRQGTHILRPLPIWLLSILICIADLRGTATMVDVFKLN